MTQSDDYTLVNIFTPKPSRAAEFLDLQLRETAKLAPLSAEKGWLGNAVYRSRDDDRVVIVTRFASRAAKDDWAASTAFQDHIQTISPYLKAVDSIPVEVIARHRDG